MQLPLPFALRIVNCYLIQDNDGWTIVDTGINIPQAQAVWRLTFDSLSIRPRDIKRLVLTHMHPDHYGMAGWFQELCGEDGAVPPVEGGSSAGMRRSDSCAWDGLPRVSPVIDSTR